MSDIQLLHLVRFKRQLVKPISGYWIIVCALALNLSFAQSDTETASLAADGLTLDRASTTPLLVKKVNDFDIIGSGTNMAWEAVEWNRLSKLDEEGPDYPSKFKIQYSHTGIYILFEGTDVKITTSDYEDMDRIWNGDVFEVFFHPDPKEPIYFEYEVNQFGKQLLLTISESKNGVSWIPFSEYGKNTYGTYTKVNVSGGEAKIGGDITSWRAEVFISYKSLGLLSSVPPKSGAVWNANFCRLDHDTGKMVKWSWTPTIEKSLHELDKFRTIAFE